jgi:hypothetical protein
MMTIDEVRKFALSFPEAYEQEHFGMPSFRVKKKIYSTIWIKENRVMVKLSPEIQSVFCAVDKASFSPVPGGWGAKGATFVELSTVKEEIFQDAMTTAYCGVAPKKLAAAFLPEKP